MDRLCVTQVNNVFYLDHFDGNAHILGTLHLTLTHVFFIGASRKQEIWLNNQLISSVERLPLTTGGAPIIIRGKNFRVIQLILPRERDCHNVYTTIKRLMTVESVSELPCFCLSPPECSWSRTDGWNRFDMETQLRRFGLPNSTWELTNVNDDYQVCDTYPTVLCVPSNASKSMLKASARFRSRGRFPVLTYLHSNGKSALCRSSQPLAGFSSKCIEDQFLLEAIRLANPSCSVLYVVDTRPALNALTNRAQGKGYEDATVYRNIAIQFFDIENIHVVRNSLEKLLKVCQEPALPLEQYHQGLEKSGWFRHLRAILEAAFFVANRLNEGNSVLVHCSDGWDRTAQVCSLAQIVLDPYYRTFVGLEALIKKEWIFFGHKFSERLGLTNAGDPREISPIFCQFLNCVHHLIELCPTKFEYNSTLLSLLHDEAYSAIYGTFVGCSEKDRRELRISQSTYSVWPLIDQHRNEFINPYYDHADHLARGLDISLAADNPFDDVINGIELTATTGGNCRHAVDMLPSFVLAPQLFRLWHGLFLRWEWRLPRPEIQHMEVVSDVIRGQNTLASHRRLLEARIAQLCTLLGRPLDSVLSRGDETSSSVKPPVEDASSSNEVIAVAHLSAHLDLPDVFASSMQSPQFRRSKSDTPDCSTEQREKSSSTLKHRKTVLEDAKQLSLVSSNQLSLEVNSISSQWSHISRRDILCSVCGTLLVLSTNSAHCHCCGTSLCSRCVSQKPPEILGLWESKLSAVCVCEHCAAKSSFAGPKHFSQLQQNKKHSINCTDHWYDAIMDPLQTNACQIRQ